jgi:hypothetical protein
MGEENGSDQEPVLEGSPSPKTQGRPNALSPDIINSKNINPYVAAVNSPKTKSGHIATMKSLGMLHELQVTLLVQVALCLILFCWHNNGIGQFAALHVHYL